jgi:hypothetical protein
MIRRVLPLGAESPERWLLIRQPDHARLSYELAVAWGGEEVDPLVCSAEDVTHPLASVRAEFLAAVRRHDEGWIGYRPLLDRKTCLPLSFTEMPADASQAIWNGSIDACREIGPLAGWVVASHFHALQAKHDADHAEWEAWLAAVQLRRAAWRDEWLAASPLHTAALADRCLAWLQAFDWMSLWLCCVCPVARDDAMPEPLVVGSEATGWPTIRFTPSREPDVGPRRVSVTPWPFGSASVELSVTTRPIDALGAAVQDGPTSLAWRLEP